MKPSVFLRAAAGFGLSATLAAGLVAASAGATLAANPNIFVAPATRSSSASPSCANAPYSSINAAIAAAPAHATIHVCHGTYAEGVLVNKPVTLKGDSAVINATGQDVGIKITASWVRVQGFTVWGATAEGILAQGTPQQIMFGDIPVTTGTPVSHVAIVDNVVKNNDRGDFGTASSNPECMTQGEVPGDCGEGIHLWSAAWSTVEGNVVHDNSGGILLTDEFGPTHNNLVANNLVYDNTLDCGITVPGHNLGINPFTHELLPTIAGVYDNTISGNTVFGNGVKGFGAGIGLFSPAPVTAVYDNTVSGNDAWGNGLGGVTMHTHAPGAYLDGNRIVSNTFGTNNVDGDGDAGDFATTGIIVSSALSPVTVTISGNTISHNHYGIFTAGQVSAPNAATDNTFIDVAVPFFHV